MNHPETITLNLFGPLSITRQGEALALPPSLAARSLLAYLLLNRRKEHARAVLAEMFWPETGEDQARRSLSQALWQIGRCLPGAIQADSQAVRAGANLPLWIDSEEFIQLIDAPGGEQAGEARIAALRQAIQLYRGDFLEGRYENWALLEAERLRELYLHALGELCRLEKLAGRYGEALQAAQLLVQKDPLDEAAQREVMRLHVALQHPEAALKQYQALRTLLQTEMSIAPEEQTTALAGEIARSTRPGEAFPYLPAAPPSTPLFEQPGRLVLLGRQVERSQILVEMEAMLQGRGGLLLIEGEAGIGKTRLAQEAARDAEWRDIQTLWGAAESETAKGGFAPLIQALGSALTPLRCAQLTQVVQAVWLQTLRPLLPILDHSLPQGAPASLAAQTEHERLLNAFAELLDGWSRVRPLLLILENLHWVDADSLHVLEHLLQRLPAQRLLILATCQSEAPAQDSRFAAALEKLLHSAACRRISLKPLDAAACGELARRCLGLSRPAPAFEARLYHEARGNPLFLIELLRGLHNEGLLYQDESGEWHTPVDDATLDYSELPLPAALEHSLARRLERLEAQPRAVLQAAAVQGGQVDLALLGQAVDMPAAQLFPLLEALTRRRFLIEEPHAYAFAHNQVRQFIYQSCPAAERKTWHARTAQAIQAAGGARFAELAYHFTLAEDWQPAVESHIQAARHARRINALHTALEHASTALRILESRKPYGADPAHHGRLRFDLLAERQMLWWIDGKTAQQGNDLQQLLALAEQLNDPALRLSALIHQATFLCNTMDDYAAARQAAGQALELSRQSADRRAEADALELLGVCAYFTDHYHQAVEAYLASEALFRDCADETAVTRLILRLGRAYKNLSRPDDAVQAFQAALELARRREHAEQEMYALTALATMQRVQGDYLGAIGHNEAALHIARQIGHRSGQATLLDNLGVAYWTLREYGQALASIGQALEIMRQMGDRRGVVFCLLNLGGLYGEIGAYRQAQAVLDEAHALAQEIGFRHAAAVILISRGGIHLENSRPDPARALFEQALELGRRIEAQAVCGGAWAGLGRCHLLAQAYTEAAQCFRSALECHEADGEADYAAADRSYLAYCCLLQGDPAQAWQLSSQAVTELEAHPGGEEITRIYLHHILIAQAAGQTTAAGEKLRQVYRLLQTQAQTLPETLRPTFLEQVYVNREICRLYHADQAAGLVTARLPSAHAPSGRPLRPDEWVQVQWTPFEAGDAQINEPAARRRAQVRRLLRQAQEQGAAPTIDDLAAALRASRATIKRDLAAMRQAGEHLATRGQKA